MALLLVVAVSAVVGFQVFFKNYQLGIFTDVEQKVNVKNNAQIQDLIGNSIYIKNDNENLTIEKIKVGNNNCEFTNSNLSFGIYEIKLKNCIKKTGVENVMVLTNKGILEKSFFLKKVEGCDFDSLFLEKNQKVLAFKKDNLIFPQMCESEERICLKSGKLTGSFNFSKCEIKPLNHFMMHYLNPENKYSSFRSLDKTSNNNIIAVGYSNSFGSTHDNILLTKNNINGQEIWSKLLKSEYDMNAYNVLILKNQDILISGSGVIKPSLEEDSVKYGYFLSRLDSKGNQIWTNFLYDNNFFRYTYDMKIVEDGIILISSYENVGKYIVISKINFYGKLIWSKRFSGEVNEVGSNYNSGYNILPLLNGEFILTGSVTKNYDADLFIAKFDKNGNRIWGKSLQISKYESGNSIIKTKDGNLLVVGETNSFSTRDIILIKVDIDGNKIWSKRLDSGKNDYSRGLLQLNNSEIIISGITGSNLDIFFIKLTSNGNKIWSKIIDYEGGFEYLNNNGLSLIEDNIFLIGHSQSYSASPLNSFIFKSNTNLNCNGCSQVKTFSLDIYDNLDDYYDFSDFDFLVYDIDLNEYDLKFNVQNISMDSTYDFYG